MTPDPFYLTCTPKAFRVFSRSLLLRSFLLMCLDVGLFPVYCILGPKHLVGLFICIWASVPGNFRISLILFSPIHFLIFLFFFFWRTPGSWMFGTSTATLIYFFLPLFSIALIFLLYIMLKLFFFCWVSFPRVESWEVRAWLRMSGMGAGLALFSINSFYFFHCAGACLAGCPQVVTLVEFL